MAKINYFSEKVKELGNTGFKQMIKNKEGVIVGALISLDGQMEFENITAALTKSNWETKMKLPKNQRTYMLPLFHSIEDKSTDDVFSTSLQGDEFSEWGKISFTAYVDANAYLALNLNGFTGKDLDVAFINTSSSITMRTPDKTKLTGFSCEVFVGKPKMAAQGEKMLIPITFTLKDAQEFIFERAVIEPMNQTAYWNPKTDLDGVYDVELTLSEATATGCKIAVTKNSIDSTMTTAGVSGLVNADFILKNATGVVQVITTVEESDVPGVYDVAATLGNDFTFELAQCSAISLTTIKIEGTNIATVTGIE